MNHRTLILRSLAHRRRPVAVALLALAIASALAATLLALRLDIRAGLERELASYGPNLLASAERGLSPAQVRAIPGATATFGFRVARAGSVSLVAVSASPEAVRPLHPFWRVEGRWPGRGEGLLGERAAARLGLAPGEVLELRFPGTAEAPVRLTVSGLVSTGGAEEGQVLAWAADLPEVPATVAVARVPGSLAEVAAAAERLRGHGLDARPIRRVAAGDARLLERVEALMGWLGLAIVGTCLLCAGAQLGALGWQRRGEVALMRALGAGRAHLARQFLAEAGVLGLLGGLAGGALGVGGAAWMARAMFGVELQVRWPVFPLVILLGVLLALAAQWLPLQRALRLDPAGLLRGD